MSPPFIALDLHDFRDLLAEWNGDERRAVDAVHLQHSRWPRRAGYRGHASIVDIWNAHTGREGWSDIAQHLTVAPDGTLWTGRHWNRPPVSARGKNGNARVGPFLVTLFGDFDKEPLDGSQRAAAVWAIAALLDRFDLPVEALHPVGKLTSTETSAPGSSVDPAVLGTEVKAALDWLRATPDEQAKRPGPPERSAHDPAGSYIALGEARRWLRIAGRAASEDDGDAELRAGTPLEQLTRRTADGTRGLGDGTLDAEALAELRPHVVNLTAGKLSSTGRYTTDQSDLSRIFDVELPAYVADKRRWKTAPKLVLVAHGGLVEEEKGLLIALNQLDWWRRNGVYPLFFVWETGLLEEIGRIVGVSRSGARSLGDITDGWIEAAVRRPGGRIWRAMQGDARAAFEGDEAGGSQVVARLVALLAACPSLELHAWGHSAGSIFHNHLLPALAKHQQDGRTIKPRTVALLAPAVTAAAYKAGLGRLVGDGTRLALFTMARDYELADTVTPLYRKSLLYMIMRALEPEADTPVLGLDECLRRDPELRAHFGLDRPPPGGKPDAEVIFSKTRGTTGISESRAVRHGDFDNDAPTMDSVLRRVLGDMDAATLAYPYPTDPVSRDLAGVAADSPRGDPLLGGDRPPASPTPARPPALPPAPTAPSGARRALVIGIDDYPDPRAKLMGCVADSHAWTAGLRALGYAVDSLHDAAATRAAIVERVRALIASGAPGDSLVIQFAGHGTQVPDLDADEADDARDEAFCPVDYADGGFIVDDDFRSMFNALPAGVALTCFFDCCHSGTITRLGIGKDDTGPASRPRFLIAPAAAVARFRARVRAEGKPPAGGRGDMRQVVFAACKPEQVALETDGRGDFSRRAVPLLARAATLTNAQFRDAVTEAFGPQPKQHPNLDCADDLEAAPLLAGAASASASAAAPAVGTAVAEATTLIDRAAALLRTAG